MLTDTRRRTEPLVATEAPTPESPVATPAPTPTPVVHYVAHRSAAAAGWWVVSLLLAALAVAGLAGVLTLERASRRDLAVPALTAGIQAPTERLLVDQLTSDAEDADPTISASADLVTFEVDRAAAAADPSSVARDLAVARATELYDNGLPPDPGPSRTDVGVSRSIVSAMSARNHDQVADARLPAAIVAAALLLTCLFQARDDNMLLLPACALGAGWLLAKVGAGVIAMMLQDVNGASHVHEHTFAVASAGPLDQVRLVAAGLLAGAALYRLLTMARRRLERRRAAKAATAAAAAAEADVIIVLP